jgi:hypothetical protein
MDCGGLRERLIGMDSPQDGPRRSQKINWGNVGGKEFQVNAAFAAGSAALMAMSHALAPAAGEAPVPARAKYLVLDTRIIDKVDGARLAVGTAKKHPANPLFREDRPWEPRFDNLYANVLYDEQEKLYRCWYSPFIVDKAAGETPREKRSQVPYRPRGREMGVCYAVSKDGLKWEKPELGLIEFGRGKANNLVLRGPHGAGVFRDPRDPDSSRRYKMFYKGRGMCVRFSSDGLRWGEEIRCPPIAARGDTHNNALWCPERGKYVGITRLWKGQRIVGRTESSDFRQWTKAVEVLRGDRENQTYAMPVFRYAGVYLGLVMVFRPRPNRVHCELAWSPDTVAWRRIDPGTPLIPLSGKQGDYDWGCAYAAACPVIRKDEIRLYYGASNGPHGNWRESFLALATLRPDGFAGFEPKDRRKAALVHTQPVLCNGSTLQVSADAKGGRLRVAVRDAKGLALDDAEPIDADVTDATVRWRGGGDLSSRKGKLVRLTFELKSAKLYAFRFAD